MSKCTRVLAMLLALLIPASLMAGCSSAGSDSSAQGSTQGAASASTAEANSAVPTLRFAHSWTGASDPKNEIFERMVTEYAEQHKDTVNIKFEATAGMAHQDKIKVDLAAGDLPDLFMYWGGESNLAPMVENDLILDIDTYCSVSETVSRDQWSEGTFQNFALSGKVYSFPVESFKGFFIYNKSLFDQYGVELPKTYSELKEVSKVFIENGIVPMGGSSKGGDPGHLYYNAVLYQLPGGLENQELGTTHQFATDANLEAARIIEEMRTLNMFPDDTIANGSFENCTILYGEEKCAMMLCFPWLIGGIKTEVLEKSVIADFPKMDDAVVDPKDFNLGSIAQALVITKKAFEDTGKQAALVNFADFIVSDEMFVELAKTTMMPAKNVQFSEDAAQDLDPMLVAASEYTAPRTTYTPMWFLMSSSNVATTYTDSVDELFAGAVTPQEFIDKVQAAFDKEAA